MNLLKQFNEMKCQPLFEVELDGLYEIYHIMADDKGLHAGGAANCGFLHSGIMVEWDECFSLDEHLESLYELCYDDMLKGL